MTRFIPFCLTYALIQSSCAATDTPAGTGPVDSATTTVAHTSGTAPRAPATLKITRLLPRSPDEQLTRGRRMHVEGETIPEGYVAENSWLILKEAGESETAPLYRCDFDLGNGSTLSRRASSPGMTSHEIIGYIYTKPGPGRIELRSVNPKGTPGKGYFVTDFTNCEGDAYREEEFLGYAYRSLPYSISISVSPSTIRAGDDLKISWKTTYVPEGQEGRVNRFPDRILGLALSPATVSGAFIDEDGNITGTPKTDPFAKHVPLTGSYVWQSSRNMADECPQKLPPGDYQIQFALFPECFYSGTSPCDWQFEDILFTASDVFTVAEPSAP
jgi:hypothetical protein